MTRGEPTLIGSVQRALHLLDAVASADGPVPAKVLARQTGQPLSTSYHLLRTLVHEGYLRRDADGYLLGERLANLTLDSRSQLLAARVRPALKALHDDLGCAAYLGYFDDDEIRLADIVDSRDARRVDLVVPFQDAAHATALGKCLLAALPVEHRRDYLAQHELNDLTPHTITQDRTLLERLAAQRAYAVDREEYALGTSCVAVRVPVPALHAAVAVSMPRNRLPEVLGNRRALSRAAHRIGVALRTAGPI